jgi:hypothetical protein
MASGEDLYTRTQCRERQETELFGSPYGAPDAHFQLFCDFLELSYDQEHYVSVG